MLARFAAALQRGQVQAIAGGQGFGGGGGTIVVDDQNCLVSHSASSCPSATSCAAGSRIGGRICQVHGSISRYAGNICGIIQMKRQMLTDIGNVNLCSHQVDDEVSGGSLKGAKIFEKKQLHLRALRLALTS